jgi:hypothetical protein
VHCIRLTAALQPSRVTVIPVAACGKSYEATGSTILTPAHGLRRTCKGRSSRLLSGRGLQTGPQLALRLCCRIGNFRKRRDALHNLRTAETSTEAPAARRNNRTPFQKTAKPSHLISWSRLRLTVREVCGTPLTPAGTDVARSLLWSTHHAQDA